MVAVQAARGRRLPRHMQRGTHILGKAWGPWRNDGKAYGTFRLLSSQKLLVHPCVSMRANCATASGRRLPHHMQRGTHIPGKAWGPWRNASQHYDKRIFASTQEPANMTTTLAFPPDVDRSMSDAVRAAKEHAVQAVQHRLDVANFLARCLGCECVQQNPSN